MIAVDAMGGDHAPFEIVAGAYEAAKLGVSVCLFGDEIQIYSILKKLDATWRSYPIFVEHSSEIIEMGEEPSRSVLRKKDSSLVRAAQAVADKTCTAVISAGNSGAALVVGTLILGRLNGIERPAIGSFLPTENGEIFCIDIGANADCKPQYLKQFGMMGQVYCNMVKGVENPSVVLLSNGTECHKGSCLVKESFDVLKNSKLNFIGNVEPINLFTCGADVLVCDGFSGNILLKTMQGTSNVFSSWLKKEYSSSLFRRLIGAMNYFVLQGLKAKTDYKKRGGALLFGVNHPLIIAHGRSTSLAIKNAILQVSEMVQKDFLKIFNDKLSCKIKEGF
ncbi:MAG: Phosphate acyltransferase [candidate division TM6 bacterium GW2011_GWF2_32_72]|nr:MAG: Phosphate acyltransferase [candidate division TM6 bacterium GW2011_GWF2_32_72]